VLGKVATTKSNSLHGFLMHLALGTFASRTYVTTMAAALFVSGGLIRDHKYTH